MTDAFPNYFSGRLPLSAANTFTTQSVDLPVNRLGRVSGTQAVVLEFLWALIDIDGADFVANTDLLTFNILIGRVPTAVSNINNPDVLGKIELINDFVTSGMAQRDNVRRIEMQSTDGHGQLVAAEQIHLAADSTGQAGAVAYNWRIYYRFVKIPAMEMMGLLQSQTT